MHDEHTDRGFTHSTMDNHLTRVVDDFHQHQRFYHRGAYRKVGTSFLCFFFCVTRLKPFLVASNQTFPLYPTTTCHLGGSPGTSSVGLTCLVAIRTDTWPPLWAPTSLFRASGSHITRRATRSGRHRLRLRSRFDVPSQCSSKPYPHRQLVPSLGPFRGRFVRCSFEVASRGILCIERALQRSTRCNS
jgi:hypothetical protein